MFLSKDFIKQSNILPLYLNFRVFNEQVEYKGLYNWDFPSGILTVPNKGEYKRTIWVRKSIFT